MLSDEVIAFFEAKGYTMPAVGSAVFQGGHWGTPGGWYVRLFHEKTRMHHTESGPTAVEAVANMIRRLGGSAEELTGRKTGSIEGLSAALAGLTRAFETNAWIR